MPGIDEHLSRSADFFAAATSGEQVPLNTVLGLRTLLQGLNCPDRNQVSPSARDRLQAAIFDGVPGLLRRSHARAVKHNAPFAVSLAKLVEQCPGELTQPVSQCAAAETAPAGPRNVTVP
jgi:hypothetical protein